MKPLSLRRCRDALIVAPHPDDEAIGAYGLIRSLRLRGARVRIVVIADGAGSHPASLRWPRPRLIAKRRRETRHAMGLLGVAADDIAFLGLPDGAVGSAPKREWMGLRRAIAAIRPGGLLVLPDAADDHPDHRAVARAASHVPSPGIWRLSYLVWPDRRRGGRPRPTHNLAIAAVRMAKRAAILRYRTQCGVIRDDPAGFEIAPHELRAFARPIEQYREVQR